MTRRSMDATIPEHTIMRPWCALLCVQLTLGCGTTARAEPAAPTTTRLGRIEPNIRLTLVPPPPVSDRITLEARVALHNSASVRNVCDFNLFWDREVHSAIDYQERIEIPPESTKCVSIRIPMRGRCGHHELIAVATSGATKTTSSQPVEVIASGTRSTGRIDGAWCGFYHWSEEEGRLWNSEIRKMTDDQWRELVRAMHSIQMNVVVIQEVFRNQAYRGRHSIERNGYKGKAFYPSRLYPDRMPITAKDPVEAVLTEADRLGMYVFLGVGHYAFFDFTKGALDWHKGVASELWTMYGHHASFYGWYVSAEVCGDLGGEPVAWREIVDFFREFRDHVRTLAPDKPVMLASNSHHVPRAAEVYPKLLPHLDILCPFGFHRPPADDISGEAAAALLQRLCDQSGTHLWLDLEVFLFGARNALVPRPIEGLISDLRRFPSFEKVLCYQFPGLMNAPWATIKPGGADTVRLYGNYREFLGGP